LSCSMNRTVSEVEPKFRFRTRNPYPIQSLRGRIDRGNLMLKSEIASPSPRMTISKSGFGSVVILDMLSRFPYIRHICDAYYPASSGCVF